MPAPLALENPLLPGAKCVTRDTECSPLHTEYSVAEDARPSRRGLGSGGRASLAQRGVDLVPSRGTSSSSLQCDHLARRCLREARRGAAALADHDHVEALQLDDAKDGA